MGIKRLRFVVGLVAALTACVGQYKSNFQIVVVNRVPNAIQVLANGNDIGQVAAGQTGTFTLNLTETNTNAFTNGVAPTPQSEITVAARDVKTGVVSEAKTTVVSKGTPTYVTFTSEDFPVSSPTVARFTFSPANPGPNEDVSFSASTSTATAGTYTWDFGDGGTGTGVTVSHRFPRPAMFTVTLTVTSNNGQSSTASRAINVSTVLQTPVSFTVSPAAPAVNQDVFFNASASNVSGGTYTWDFGDGTGGTGVTTTHRYPRAGTFAVNLRVTNSVGQASSTSRAVTVSATSPLVVANFTFSPTTPGINQDVFFNASASTPPSGTYTWNFGDGTTGSGITPSHRYGTAGTYIVTLTVANDVGQSSTTTRTVTVSATSAQVVASFTFSPTIPGINQEVFFDASASRPITGSFTWSFGDGSNGVGISPTHRYSDGGTYTVTLRITNEFGQSATTTRIITVSPVSPQVFASFSFSPTTPEINQDVFFNASASRPADGRYTWTFGDGTGGAGIAPVHRFAQPGTYTVTLTVTNDFGQSSTTTRSITVVATTIQVSASFTFSPTAPAINQEVVFNASASTPANGIYAWDWGDGTPGGTGVTPTHRFARAGTFTVSLTVTNSLGQSAATSRAVGVAAPTPPTASFSFSPATPTTGQTVFFNGSASTSVSGTTISSYAWDFGDGTSGSGVTPSKVYTTAATFVVRLTVTDSMAQTGTTTQTVPVSLPAAPTANFSFSPTSPTTGQTVFFNGSGSSSASGTTITSYAWDFGDGIGGTGVTTSRAFANAGSFVVRLTVTDSNARTGTTTQTVTVTAPAFTADFSFSPTNPAISAGTNTVNFDATPSSASATSWTWDFGDGTATVTGQKVSRLFGKPGTWVVRLTIGDAAGRTATTTKNVPVTQ